MPQVLRGIDAAQSAGLRVKINTVALKGFNEDELFRLTEWCAERDMDMTWIEVMPMESGRRLKTVGGIGRSTIYESDTRKSNTQLLIRPNAAADLPVMLGLRKRAKDWIYHPAHP